MHFKILCFSVLISVVGGQQLEQEPQTTAVRVGNSVTFLCTLTADQVDQGWTINWKKKENYIYFNGASINPTKYIISGNADLQIKDVTTEDAGVYECLVKPMGDNAPTPFDKTATLIVIGKMDCPNDNKEMVEQGKGEVTCMAEISPTEQDFELKWYNKAGTELPCNKTMDGSRKSCEAHFIPQWNDVSLFCRLEIVGVMVEDQCETSPPFVINYAVRQLEIMPFDMSGGQKKEFYSGEILNCSALGHPEPTYIWEELNTETAESMEEISTEASLPLNGMLGEKKFRCKASNSFGGKDNQEQKDTPIITVLKGTGTGEVGDNNAGMHVTVSLAVISMTSLISLIFARYADISHMV